LIKCNDGYYTEYASKEKDIYGEPKEFGDRLVQNPNEHRMNTFSEYAAFSNYGKEKLKKIEESGFINPRFVKFLRSDCVVLMEA
jgi:hypothetical protein